LLFSTTITSIGFLNQSITLSLDRMEMIPHAVEKESPDDAAGTGNGSLSSVASGFVSGHRGVVVDENSVNFVLDSARNNQLNTTTTSSASAPAEILPEATDGRCSEEEEEEDDYEYEDEEDAAFTGFLVDHPLVAATNATPTVSASNVSSGESSDAAVAPATIQDEEEPADAKQRWREPSKDAVKMSLRAEKETSGGKRRLAQDLYRIMNQDTKKAGFSLKPSKEDSMERWTIKLFKFDEDSNLAKDMLVLGLEHIELEMSFPEQYPFEPPFVRVSRPRFKRQTGFVMNGALCMELLTNEGWNPINDIESVIVSVRSLLVVGDGRLEAACNLADAKYRSLLDAAVESQSPKQEASATASDNASASKRLRKNSEGDIAVIPEARRRIVSDQGGSYSVSEAQSAYSHLSDYHKKKGWDTSGWWARKG
jgi:ubiquitin-protein ligase